MTDNRTTELLPCPFCGGEVQWKDGRIRCENCDFGFRRYFDHERNNQAWNTRAELGSGTCEMEWASDWLGWHCKACDSLRQGLPDQKPTYCPNCGCKVVGE